MGRSVIWIAGLTIIAAGVGLELFRYWTMKRQQPGTFIVIASILALAAIVGPRYFLGARGVSISMEPIKDDELVTILDSKMEQIAMDRMYGHVAPSINLAVRKVDETLYWRRSGIEWNNKQITLISFSAIDSTAPAVLNFEAGLFDNGDSPCLTVYAGSSEDSMTMIEHRPNDSHFNGAGSFWCIVDEHESIVNHEEKKVVKIAIYLPLSGGVLAVECLSREPLVSPRVCAHYIDVGDFGVKEIEKISVRVVAPEMLGSVYFNSQSCSRSDVPWTRKAPENVDFSVSSTELQYSINNAVNASKCLVVGFAVAAKI